MAKNPLEHLDKDPQDAAYDADYTRRMRRLTNAHSIAFGEASSGLFGMMASGTQAIMGALGEGAKPLTRKQVGFMSGMAAVGLGAMLTANSLHIKIEQLKDNRLARRIRQGADESSAGLPPAPASDISWRESMLTEQKGASHER